VGGPSALASMKAREMADGNEPMATVLQQMVLICAGSCAIIWDSSVIRKAAPLPRLVELSASKGVNQPRRVLVQAAQLQQVLVSFAGIGHGAVVLPQAHNYEPGKRKGDL